MKLETDKYILKEPIKFGDETITELNFIKPQVKHLLKLDGVIGDVAKSAKMIEICANIPPSMVAEMSARDFIDAGIIVNGFFT